MSSADPRDEMPTGMPRWVRISLIVAATLVVLFVVAKVAGVGGEHGPGRHGLSRTLAGDAHRSSTDHRR